MPLVHQHEIVGLERIYGDRLLTHVLFQLVDVNDLNRPASEQPTPLLREEFGLHPRKLEFAQVLLRKPLVRREGG